MPHYIPRRRLELTADVQSRLDNIQGTEFGANHFARFLARQGGIEHEVDEQAILEAVVLLRSINLNRYNGSSVATFRTREAIRSATEAAEEALERIYNLHWARHRGEEPWPRLPKNDSIRAVLARLGLKR